MPVTRRESCVSYAVSAEVVGVDVCRRSAIYGPRPYLLLSAGGIVGADGGRSQHRSRRGTRHARAERVQCELTCSLRTTRGSR